MTWKVIPLILIFLFVVKLIGDLLPTFNPFKLLSLSEIYVFGAVNIIWSDDRPIDFIFAPPVGV